MANHDAIVCSNWRDFIDHASRLDEDFNERNNRKKLFFRPLYRGHGCSGWKLKTTLERYSKSIGRRIRNGEYLKANYDRIIESVEPVYLSHNSNRPIVEKDWPKSLPKQYALAIQLRHFGFPSPILDWTTSKYVASYFAFSDKTDCEYVAIYSYWHTRNNTTSNILSAPHIELCGGSVITSTRHHIQQCEYTICHKNKNEDWFYCSHELPIYNTNQHHLQKFIIPKSEKQKVLNDLDSMNINAYTLFGNEEGLMETLAFRHIAQ